ncbi:MAG TPA: fibronectin type III domain-containing protein, partial [Trueperaceae bacterium]|nr:fibronectin type III domain-containing protein [Trueperaceae bacterium]
SGGAFDQSTAERQVGADRSEHATTATLSGLEPGTTYRWRFACKNSALHEGGEATGAERTLTTYRAFAGDTDCPNQALRSGDSAALPDCRAYEMVSPVDKNGADIVSGLSGASNPGGYVRAAPDGGALAYATVFPAFGDPPNSFRLNQYLSERQDGVGWGTRGIHPPYLGRRVPGIAVGVIREFIAFSPDLCSAWLVDYQTPPLNVDGQEEAANLYRRDNCEPGDGGFETLTDVPLPLEGEDRTHYVTNKSVQGVSDDSRHAVFTAHAKLTDNAAEGGNAQLYDRFEEKLHLVSVLPSGAANPTNAVVGSGWDGNLEGAVSEDGSRVYWTSGGASGKIYLRLQDEGKTVEVSKELAGLPFNDAFFWAASSDGSAALYSEAQSLYRFDLASEASQLIAKGVMGVAGVSEDLSHIYFVSRAALADSGANGEEDEAVAGEPNLYLATGGKSTFIATLAEGDVGAIEPGTFIRPYDLASRGTYSRATRVSPDGEQLAFQSRAQLSDFDNSAANGKPAVEVYRYEAGADRLLCVSCNPSGARPAVREMILPYASTSGPTGVFAAAWIPTWEHPLYATNVLSADGNRLFFNSNDALVPGDANGAQDVYEWEAPGTGSCTKAHPNYFAKNGGCLFLISSGESSLESIFWEASRDGSDVFFTTASSLLPQDPGSVDLYDARVGGGFAQPVEPASCEGEACQSPPPPPQKPTPASGAYRGPGNISHARSCRAPAMRARKLSRRAKRARRVAVRARRAGNRALTRRMRGKARRFSGKAAKLSRNAKRCRRANRRAGR